MVYLSRTLIALVFIFLFVTIIGCGSILPFWMFINSMQLITHIPLLRNNLPGGAHRVLVDQLYIIRLDFGALNAWLI